MILLTYLAFSEQISRSLFDESLFGKRGDSLETGRLIEDSMGNYLDYCHVSIQDNARTISQELSAALSVILLT